MNKKSGQSWKWFLVIIGVVLVVSVALYRSGSKSRSAEGELMPASSITHGHGLAVDVTDPTKLYIATHHGLLLLKDEKDLYSVGKSKDDYMGFSPHPTDSKIFFSSGHPSFGGNVGFQKSEDGGVTWKKISNGLNGPVDFHAMAVSPVDPNLVYGWFRGEVQRTKNGGKSWEKFATPVPVVNLAADTKVENRVYAASPKGLLVSNDHGETWQTLLTGFVSVVVAHPKDSSILLSFSETFGLARSKDTGTSWEKISENFSGETPLFISFNKQDPAIVYLPTEKNSVYKSINSGDIWQKIR
jgi:photosystem II stability/assembly factor-like uncharacterized protein